MTSTHPFLVGIAGVSGSGKSCLAAALSARCPGSQRFAVDAFYRDLGHLHPDARAEQNFDCPSAIEWPYLYRVLDALRMGCGADAPRYDFSTHTRATGTQRLEPGPIIVIEGLFVLQQPRMRALLDASFFLDCPREVALERRIARDIAERGRTADQVRQQFDRVAWPMAERYVLPSRVHADSIVDATAPVHAVLREALARLAPPLPPAVTRREPAGV